MRIAVVHSFYDERTPSGENTVVEEQVRTLAAAGHDVRLFARHTSDLAGRPGYLRAEAGTRLTVTNRARNNSSSRSRVGMGMR